MVNAADAKPIVALSTAWHGHRHSDGYGLLCEAADLGFSFVELGHQLPFGLKSGILRAVRSGVIQVSSVHNFCPLPWGCTRGGPNLYQPTAWEPWERWLWVKQTRQTLSFARAVGAPVVVCHLGSVTFGWRSWWDARTIALVEALRSNRVGVLLKDAAFMARLREWLPLLRRRAAVALRRAEAAVRRVLPWAEQMGVRLAFENREGVLEMPVEEECLGFIERLASPWVGAWYDSGHAHIKALWGLVEPERYLTQLQHHWCGFHLHDADAQGKDHLALGAGCIDFAPVRRQLRCGLPWVLELNPRTPREGVVASREMLQRWAHGLCDDPRGPSYLGPQPS